MLTMQVGDIWRKDTSLLHRDNTVQHWLILDIQSEYAGRILVKFLYLEKALTNDVVMSFVDLTGNPYYKKVA